ncbi:MAG: radical SAM protein [Deltaproteobacteria bacterium]|jgi:MoaA/NifB/PqqE/SkfB family radical SAM enzyme|nr:radical SAM protein [Deltaproteobacteria bacterium]
MIGRLFYLARWFFRARFLGRAAPLQTVLFVSDVCNLACKHCNILKRDGSAPRSKSYGQIAAELEYAHGLGSRFVDFSGGEPFIWADGAYTLNDLIRQARRIGFFSATVTSNGQQPLAGCAADSIWLSLDGVGGAHDQIRGPGTFAKLLANIEADFPSRGRRRLSVNMVINRLNSGAVRDTVEFAAAHPAIESIALNFHTPFPGTEALLLPPAERRAIIDELIRLKKAGLPIMNSVSGLKAMRELNFKPRCWISNFIMADGARLAECPGRRAGLCGQCGFCMAGEMASLFAFKPDTVFSGLNLRVKRSNGC